MEESRSDWLCDLALIIIDINKHNLAPWWFWPLHFCIEDSLVARLLSSQTRLIDEWRGWEHSENITRRQVTNNLVSSPARSNYNNHTPQLVLIPSEGLGSGILHLNQIQVPTTVEWWDLRIDWRSWRNAFKNQISIIWNQMKLLNLRIYLEKYSQIVGSSFE